MSVRWAAQAIAALAALMGENVLRLLRRSLPPAMTSVGDAVQRR